VNNRDVVLVKLLGKGTKDGKNVDLEYTVIDYYDEDNDLTSMMRTTAFPVSINAQLIEQGLIGEYGVFGNEEIIPTSQFFEELKKRNIIFTKNMG